MPLLLDGHWYTSKTAVDLVGRRHIFDEQHLTPDGRAVMVFDRDDRGVLVPQASHGHDMTELRADTGPHIKHRIELDPASLPDLERLVEFDHLPESRKATSWMKPGDKLA